MINEKMLEVLSYEGIVAIVSCGDNGAHVVDTWNSYILIMDNRILIIVDGGYIKRRTKSLPRWI